LIDTSANRDVIYWALATGRLSFDIESAPLATQAALVQVFRDQPTYMAWRSAVRPDGSRPNPKADDACRKLEAGDVLTLDGKRLTVRFVGNTGIVSHDDYGASCSLTFTDLEAAQPSGKLVLPIRWSQQTVRSRFYTAGPAALGRALRYARVLQKLERSEQLSVEEQYSQPTIRRWRKKVREGESRELSPVESLIDEIPSRGFHGPHLDIALNKELDDAILEALKNKLGKSRLSIYGDIEKTWLANEKKMVAKSTFYEHVKKLKSPATVRESQGHKAAHKIEPAFWILDERTPIHAEHALAWLHIDSTLLDVEVRSSLSGAVLGRPWLTLAICAHTRRVMGFHLSFRPPSYVSSMMVLADVIRRTGRLPDAVIHDWESEFKAKDFKECLAALYIERFVRPKGSPRFGSVIERMFGTTTRQLIDNIAGNTKARKDVRTLSPSADPTWHSGLWLLDLYLGLEDYFFGIYNARKHPTTLQTPDSALETSLIMQGRRLHRLRRLVDILPVISPTARGQSRVLDPARGLYVNYRYYSNPALANYAFEDKNLIVKPVPFDPGLILTFFRGNWISCRTPLTPEVANSPEVVRRCLYEEWSIEQQLAAASSDEARRKLVDLIEDLNKRALANQEYWMERKYQEVLKTAVFPSAPASNEPRIQGSGLEKLRDSMADAVRAALSSAHAGRLVA
jgi:putative transposase